MDNFCYSLMFKLTIQSGKFKGKNFESPPPIKGKENYTPAIVKKSVFSILDSIFLQNNIEKSNTVFIDLFAGSGQMAIEAVSRSFSEAILFEISKERFSFLLNLVSKFDGIFKVFLKDAFRYHSKLEVSNDKILVYFIDMPYSFWTEKQKIYKLIEDILSEYLTNSKIIVIQTAINPKWDRFESRQYGNHYLLYYSQL